MLLVYVLSVLCQFAVRLLAIFNVSLCDGHSGTENVVCGLSQGKNTSSMYYILQEVVASCSLHLWPPCKSNVFR